MPRPTATGAALRSLLSNRRRALVVGTALVLMGFGVPVRVRTSPCTP